MFQNWYSLTVGLGIVSGERLFFFRNKQNDYGALQDWASLFGIDSSFTGTNGTEWNGMKRNGTERNGMEQNGTEQNGMEWNET